MKDLVEKEWDFISQMKKACQRGKLSKKELDDALVLSKKIVRKSHPQEEGWHVLKAKETIAFKKEIIPCRLFDEEEYLRENKTRYTADVKIFPMGENVVIFHVQDACKSC